MREVRSVGGEKKALTEAVERLTAWQKKMKEAAGKPLEEEEAEEE